MSGSLSFQLLSIKKEYEGCCLWSCCPSGEFQALSSKIALDEEGVRRLLCVELLSKWMMSGSVSFRISLSTKGVGTLLFVKLLSKLRKSASVRVREKGCQQGKGP